ncbi:MAG TPA: GGDEF domain-containing protein [Candidatus Binatia bacterium]|jgi:diguanylate cyclase (GGDEF)-like protein
MIQKITKFLERRSKRALAALAYSIAIFLGLLDFITAVKIHFLLLYLVPIFIGSWFISKSTGIRLAIFTSLIWFVAHSFSGSSSAGWIAYSNLAMRTAVFVLFAITQAQLRAKLDDLSNLATRDFLTGLPNGHAFYQLTAREMDRAFGVEPMTLVCVDVEGFDWVNHRFGHPTGDQIMCTIAHTIKQHVPRPDLVGRVGGTSFAILLPNIASNVASLILETVQEALHEERRRCSHPLTFFISAIACARAPRTVAELIQEADAQMTRIKGGKKDTLQIARVDNLPVLN